MFPSNHQSNKSAIAWALFSQCIWIPAFVMNAQDQMASKSNDYDFRGVAKLPSQNIPNYDTSVSLSLGHHKSLLQNSLSSANHNGIVLNAIESRERHLLSVDSSSANENTLKYPAAFSAPSRPNSLDNSSLINSGLNQRVSLVRQYSNHSASNDLINRLYSKAELLGGTLTLNDLNEPDMPPIARAERAQWNRSGDPLAPIPKVWRESMRKALNSLATNVRTGTDKIKYTSSEDLNIDTARVVHVPSRKVKHAADVPLALQSDGSVDILTKPEDPAVVEEIKNWSANQSPPSKGRMTPAVVHLHPLPVDESSETSTKKLIPITPPDDKTVQSVSSREQPPSQLVSPHAMRPASVPIPTPTERSEPITEPVSSRPHQSQDRGLKDGADASNGEVKP